MASTMIFNKRIRSLEKKVEELDATLDKVLKAIDSKSFLEDFEKFQKWVQLKKKIPTLEIYMLLKQLKVEMDCYRKAVDEYEENPYEGYANSMYAKESDCKGVINKIRQNLQDQNMDSEEVLLLYGLNKDDLEQFIKNYNKK